MGSGTGLVAALQAGTMAVLGVVAGVLGGTSVALSLVAGGACGLAGTLVYGGCLRLLTPPHEPLRLVRAHLFAQIAKMAVILALLALGLSMAPLIAPAFMIVGFAAALMVFPFALLLHGKKHTG